MPERAAGAGASTPEPAVQPGEQAFHIVERGPLLAHADGLGGDVGADVVDAEVVDDEDGKNGRK